MKEYHSWVWSEDGLDPYDHYCLSYDSRHPERIELATWRGSNPEFGFNMTLKVKDLALLAHGLETMFHRWLEVQDDRDQAL